MTSSVQGVAFICEMRARGVSLFIPGCREEFHSVFLEVLSWQGRSFFWKNFDPASFHGKFVDFISSNKLVIFFSFLRRVV